MSTRPVTADPRRRPAVPPLAREQWRQGLEQECRQVGGPAFRPDRNVYATLAHSPATLVAWVRAGAAALAEARGRRDDTDTERVIVWTAACCGGRYVLARHQLAARTSGIEASELHTLCRLGDARTWPKALSLDDDVIPLIRFYALASIVLELLDTRPDADIATRWPPPAAWDWMRAVHAIRSLTTVGERSAGPLDPVATILATAGAGSTVQGTGDLAPLVGAVHDAVATGTVTTARRTPRGPAAQAVMIGLGLIDGADDEGRRECEPAREPELVAAIIECAITAVGASLGAYGAIGTRARS